MIFDRPTTRLVPTTMLAVSIGMGGGYLLGFGVQTAAGEGGAHWVGLAAGGACAVLAGTVTIALLVFAEAMYWQYKTRTMERPPVVEPDGFHKLELQVDENVTQNFWLSVDVKQLEVLTRSAINDRSLSHRRWSGKGRPFQPQEWAAVMREMLDNGMAERVGNTNTLSETGARALKDGRVSPARATGEAPVYLRTNERVFKYKRLSRQGSG